MDAFTTIVAPVAMTSGTKNDKRKREEEQRKATVKKAKEKGFEEQFAAIYIPTAYGAEKAPPTYNRPVKKYYA